MQVEYERFQRHVAPATLQLHLSREATSGDTVSVWMSRSLVDALEIQRIEPEPQEERTAQGGIAFRFGTTEPGMPATIRFFTIVQKIGTVDGQIGVADREPARFTQFVYP